MSNFGDTVCNYGAPFWMGFKNLLSKRDGILASGAFLDGAKIQISLKLHKCFLERGLEVSLSSNSICPIDLYLQPVLVSMIVYFQTLAWCRTRLD